MRLIIQSLRTGRFLAPNVNDNQPEWRISLRDCAAGIVTDPEQALQLLEDWADFDDEAVIVDLDRLLNLPDGNHGENI